MGAGSLPEYTPMHQVAIPELPVRGQTRATWLPGCCIGKAGTYGSADSKFSPV